MSTSGEEEFLSLSFGLFCGKFTISVPVTDTADALATAAATAAAVAAAPADAPVTSTPAVIAAAAAALSHSKEVRKETLGNFFY